MSLNHIDTPKEDEAQTMPNHALTILLIFALLPAMAHAQDSTCQTALNEAVLTSTLACQAQTDGICHNQNGTAPLSTQSITLESAPAIEIAQWKLPIRQEDPDAPPQTMTLAAFGNLTLTSQPSDLGAWRNMTLETVSPLCSGTGRLSGVLLQTAPNTRPEIVVDGVRIFFNDTLFLTHFGGNLQINALGGDAVVDVDGVQIIVFAGFQWSVGQPATPTPYDFGNLATLPVNLLPRIPRIALPGNVTLASDTQLFSDSRENSRPLEDLLAGALLNVYGSDLTGTWRHVLAPSGQTGWVPTAALQNDLNATIPAYEATPQLTTRPFGGQYGVGDTGLGAVNLRANPAENEAILQQLRANVAFTILGRSLDDAWLYIEIIEGGGEIINGWVSAAVVNVPEGFQIGELPIAP